VTWRYTTKTAEVLKRRNECDETWLVNFTNKLSQNRQHGFDKARKEKIQLRLVTEIVEFLTPKQIKEGEDIGRQSGSLQWRLNRGEIETPTTSSNEFKFRFENLFKTDLFQIQYNPTRDVYIYENKLINGWKNAVYKFNNIQYKVENDWKMCYLARNGSDNAYIEWFIDLSQLKDKILLKITFLLESKCFENGRIDWTVYWSDSNEFYNTNNKIKLDNQLIELTKSFKLKKVNNIYEMDNFSTDFKLGSLKIRADLSLGKGIFQYLLFN